MTYLPPDLGGGGLRSIPPRFSNRALEGSLYGLGGGGLIPLGPVGKPVESGGNRLYDPGGGGGGVFVDPRLKKLIAEDYSDEM